MAATESERPSSPSAISVDSLVLFFDKQQTSWNFVGRGPFHALLGDDTTEIEHSVTIPTARCPHLEEAIALLKLYSLAEHEPKKDEVTGKVVVEQCREWLEMYPVNLIYHVQEPCIKLAATVLSDANALLKAEADQFSGVADVLKLTEAMAATLSRDLRLQLYYSRLLHYLLLRCFFEIRRFYRESSHHDDKF